MAELSPAQKLAQLRQRWERDPKSRVFLQLAEEYRRAGRLAEAVRVLESGLAAHPGYVAAQVVLGRCLLETGDSPRAVTVLERAVASDPTQIVANRLLVDAYLGIEDVRKARERLDLYRVLNDRDVDIEGLEARIAALGGEMRPATVRTRTPRDRSGEFASPVAVVDATAFDSPQPSTFSGALSGAGAAESDVDEVVRPRSEQPFGRFRGREDAHRIVTTISAAGVFPVGTIRLASPPPPSPAERPPAPTLVIPRPPVPPPEEFEPFPAAPEPPPTAAVAPRPVATPSEVVTMAAAAESVAATATLGSLYLAQGHLADAAESFEAVLDRKPDDAEALAGLAEVRRRQSAEAAAFADEAVATPLPAAPLAGGMTARKIERLRQFMASMRRGAEAHVS